MGNHLINGKFQSDKYPNTPRGFVPLSINDKVAQPLLWKYAQEHEKIDPEFSQDLLDALYIAGYRP
jgi:hypothetical protein